MSSLSFTCFFAVVLLANVSRARPVANPVAACDTSGPYFDASACLKVIQFRSGDCHPSAEGLIQGVQHPVHELADDCCEDMFVCSLKERQLRASGSRVLDVEVPLSTTYLMSLQEERPSDMVIPPEEGILRNPNSKSEFYDELAEPLVLGIENSQETEYLLCLQRSERNLEPQCGSDYWNQDRAMSLVVWIVVLFLAIILVVEAVEGLLKLSVTPWTSY